jgi:hypothetical protein
MMKIDHSYEDEEQRANKFLNNKQQTTMAITGGKFENTNFELIKAGTHVAICYGITEIGTVYQTFKGEGKWVRKVRLTFELPLEVKVFKEGEKEKPFSISTDYTMPLYEKSKLRKALDTWRGEKMADEYAFRFDLEKLLGQACMLTIIHKPSKDKVYANIDSITGMAKGMSKPLQTNDNFVLAYDKFNREIFNKQPEWIRNQIMASKEYQALVQKESAHNKTAKAHGEIADAPLEADDFNDLPF